MRKSIPLFICVLTIVSFSGCSSPDRPDAQLLSAQLAQINENYRFEYSDIFLYNGAYHVYLSLCAEDDVLLSMVWGENCNIDSITVTADKGRMDSQQARNAYRDFVYALTDCFAELSDKERKELDEKLSFGNTQIYFTDAYEKYSSLRYNFVFASDLQSLNFYCEYVELMEIASVLKDVR